MTVGPKTGLLVERGGSTGHPKNTKHSRTMADQPKHKAGILSGLATEQETSELDRSLRPHSCHEFVGQTEVLEQLQLAIQAARSRREPLDHVLLYGPPGLGKTTLANIIAAEMGTTIKSTSGPLLERKDDLAAILTDLTDGDVLFVDEIHRLSRIVEECLYRRSRISRSTSSSARGRTPSRSNWTLPASRWWGRPPAPA